MKIPRINWYALLLPAFMACSSSKQFVRLTNDHGKTKIIRVQSGSFFVIAIDSLRVDSSQYRLFSLKKRMDGSVDARSYWAVSTIDTVQQSITFRNCGNDTLRIALRKEQIKYLVRGSSASPVSARKTAADIVVMPAFFFGTIAAAWGIISLPVASTPWQDDLKMIARGAAVLGIFGIAVMIIDEPAEGIFEKDKYEIDSLH